MIFSFKESTRYVFKISHLGLIIVQLSGVRPNTETSTAIGVSPTKRERTQHVVVRMEETLDICIVNYKLSSSGQVISDS